MHFKAGNQKKTKIEIEREPSEMKCKFSAIGTIKAAKNKTTDGIK